MTGRAQLRMEVLRRIPLGPRQGIAVVVGETGRSMKSQLRSADASGARLAIIIGEDELAKGTAVVKDLRAGGEQREVPLADLTATIQSR